MKRLVLALLLAPLVFGALPAHAQVVPTLPDPALSTANSNTAVYLLRPGPGGESLGAIGATITVQLLDPMGDPIPFYPREDIVLAGVEGSPLAFCGGPAVADHDTDAAGVTTFSQALRGGGISDGLRVVVSGMPLVQAPLPIRVISPDYDGDTQITIVDISALADEFLNGTYDVDSDFNRDGVEDLADIGIFAEELYGGGCP